MLCSNQPRFSLSFATSVTDVFQGCCSSTPSSDSSPYAAQSSSSRHINDQAQPQFAPPGLARPSTAASSSAPITRPLGELDSKPLRAHNWKAKRSKKWTRRTIDKEREEFFDTRTSGRHEVWQVLRTVCELLWASSLPGKTEKDRKAAIAEAQTYLDAAEIKLRTGDLVDGVYDNLGDSYPLPSHIVADPTNLSEDAELDKDSGEHESKLVDEAPDRTAEEKGKAVIPKEDLIKVRAALSSDDKKLVVKVSKHDTVRTVAIRIHEEAGVSDYSCKSEVTATNITFSLQWTGL